MDGHFEGESASSFLRVADHTDEDPARDSQKTAMDDNVLYHSLLAFASVGEFWAICPKRAFPVKRLKEELPTTLFRTTTAQVRDVDYMS
jgi:hypothetical protein